MRPTDQLRAACIDDWQQASEHAFCTELAAGTLSLDKMKTYLIQDYTFIDNFVRLSAAAIHHAPTLADRIPLAQFLGVITGPENTYFQQSFNQLKIPEQQRVNPVLLIPTQGFQDLMLEAAESGTYANMIAVLCVAEWIYLSWASPVADFDPELPSYFSQWISLHCGEYFSSVVEHLRSQLDRALPLLNEQQQQEAGSYFARAVKLEKQFFDACYA
ncbi:MAG: thiaminase/transcriptional activator TenA [Oceanospirillaceae bacterium]|jgi:thiaminase/transcriptional activator TenA